MASKEDSRRYRQRLRERAFEAIGKVCVFCESESSVQAAHVVDTGLNGASRGMDRRYRDILNNPNSYRPMCFKCHRLFDKLTKLRKPEVVVEEPIPF